MAESSAGKRSGSHELDPYGSDGGGSGVSIGRVLARLVGILVGLGISFFGFGFYMLRCFSNCPTDPAENTISQILTLSLFGFGVVVVIAAASLRTRFEPAGSWMVTLLGALMALGGLASLVLTPSLEVPGNRGTTIILGVIDIVAGACVVLFGIWARGQREQKR